MSLSRSVNREGEQYMYLGVQHVAQWFRNGVTECQFEDGRLVWWGNDALFRLELADGEWRLFLMKPRGDA